MNFRRTFQPIGQGAFYIERNKSESIDFTVVYDCGSSTSNGKELELKIKNTFIENYPIDI
jgi:hypothetical protein